MTLNATRGELAIRAHQRARRAAASRPKTLNEAVSNKMDERLANLEATNLLKVPPDLVQQCGEAVQQDFRLPWALDRLQEPDMVSVIASEHRVDLAACVGSRVLETAIDAAQSAQAQNSLEKMLCHQMAAMHRAAMKLTADSLNRNLPPVEMARLLNAAARMMQVYQEALLALHKLKSGGKQVVVVQHVQVSEGGKPSSLEACSRGGGAGMPGTDEKTDEIPRDKRPGKLRNGNPSGDFSSAKRCGARNRRGTPCQCPAMRNGRCRLHGGLSTGAKTPEGLERIRQAATRHGRYSRQAKTEQRQFRELLREFRAFLSEF